MALLMEFNKMFNKSFIKSFNQNKLEHFEQVTLKLAKHNNFEYTYNENDVVRIDNIKHIVFQTLNHHNKTVQDMQKFEEMIL